MLLMGSDGRHGRHGFRKEEKARAWEEEGMWKIGKRKVMQGRAS